MRDLKANIKFNYLYRDTSNYKKFGSVVFKNPNSYSLHFINDEIRKSLIDSEFFNAEKSCIPTLFFHDINEDDHGWHEFENIENTYEPSTDRRTIGEFLLALNTSEQEVK